MKRITVNLFGKPLLDITSLSSGPGMKSSIEEALEDIKEFYDDRLQAMLGRVDKTDGAVEDVRRELVNVVSLLWSITDDQKIETPGINRDGRHMTAVTVKNPTWSKMTLGESRRKMAGLYNTIADSMTSGGVAEMVVRPGTDFDNARPIEKVTDAFRIALEKRGLKVKIEEHAGDLLIVKQ